MKKLILTILTTITIFGVSAQGNNLQFNQVLNYDYSVFCGAQYVLYSAGNFTVPSNKVWKITYSSVYSSSNPSFSGALLIDNIKVCAGRIESTSASDETGGILWLKSGNYSVYLMSTSTTNQDIKATISGIEFNIVQ